MPIVDFSKKKKKFKGKVSFYPLPPLIIYDRENSKTTFPKCDGEK
jgi:hypothetical protein